MMPSYDPCAALVYQANPSNIDTTIVKHGQIVMENRVMQTVQLDEIRQSVDEFEADITEFAKSFLRRRLSRRA